MNIDYEKLYQEALRNSDFTTDLGFTKALIKAYEAQKAPPEWVPLDLEKVKQGQEVRNVQWLEALKRLSFAAQTTGGVAGRDEGLCAAIDAATAVITKVVTHIKGAKG